MNVKGIEVTRKSIRCYAVNCVENLHYVKRNAYRWQGKVVPACKMKENGKWDLSYIHS